jgi:hypothetical protein
MVTSGATTCTISVSSTSSPPASHGEADEPARVVMTWIRAGQAEPAVEVCQVLADVGDRRGLRRLRSASSGSTTVTPRPSIPRSSSGWMP